MDRPVDPRFWQRQWIKRGSAAVLGLALLLGLLICLPGWIKPSLDKERIRTARVEVGLVEATITASGIVIPEFEQLLSSPIPSRVVRVLERPGALLKKGQPIVELDLSQVVLAVEKLGEELALKDNQHVRLKLDLERRLRDLDTRWRIKHLELQNLQVRSEQFKLLQASGVIAKDDARQARLAAERAAIELAQIEGEKKGEGASTPAQIEGMALEAKILQGEQEEARRRLEQAQIRADREGVLTWVIPQEGTTVGLGEVIARMADLSSFRVDATISEIHAGRVAIGLPVKVKIDEDTYLRGGFAFRTPIRLGISSFDYCEVLEGLMEGDEVVISEVKDYTHMDKVAIK